MKIIFICGSLEPGRDGVGDYVRRLAGELLNQKNQVSAVALNDGFITEPISGDKLDGLIGIPTLRLPIDYIQSERFSQLKQWIHRFQPDYISLQFVSFSFHPKGLPYGLGKLLAEAGQGRAWHLMFHELWVGMASNDTLKHKIWGKLQKNIIKELITSLQPKLVHTQCSLYFEKLQKEGYAINKLPLFSNIDIAGNTAKKYYSDRSDTQIENIVRFVFFGGLHPEAKLVELIRFLKQFYSSRTREFEFLYIGRNGGELEKHLIILQQENVSHRVVGELAPYQLSQLLATSTFGISTGSPEMLEKNGTVAAMLLHQLPVICIGRNLIFNDIPQISLMAGTYGLKDLEYILLNRPVIEFPNTISVVAQKYQYDLLQRP